MPGWSETTDGVFVQRSDYIQIFKSVSMRSEPWSTVREKTIIPCKE